MKDEILEGLPEWMKILKEAYEKEQKKRKEAEENETY